MQSASKLTPRQILAIGHLIGCASKEEASRKAKVSRGTLYAWLKEDHFKKELEFQRNELIQDSLSKLKCAINKATDGLIELLGSEREDIKRLACKDVLDFALKSIELEDYEKRISKIEEFVEGER